MAGLDNKISNIIGTKLPQWLLNQIQTRSIAGARDSRDNDNLLFLANKSCWVRLVSSVNLANQNDVNYFNRIAGNISKADDLAKQFVLFGGTSKYLNKNSYQLRSGIGDDGAYGILGNDEIQKYGYRPMPGIVGVNVETQGRLGSVRSATINFKCWDKAQLDIIDALYFKLGFTMFLEWGSTVYYTSNNTNTVQSSELLSIDPFQSDLTKEQIYIQIAKNSRQSEGNYDAMLGVVTNFTFSFNQEGGYDCQVRLMALGALAESIKINNVGTLPAIVEEEIKRLNNTLIRIEQDRLTREALERAKSQQVVDDKIDPINAEDFFNKYIKYDPVTKRYSGGQVSINSLDLESPRTVDGAFNTQAYGWVYFIRRQKGFIPLREDLLNQVKVVLNASTLENKLNSAKLSNGARGAEDPRLWDFPANYLENAKDIILKPISSIVDLLGNAFTVTKVDTGERELDKKNDTGVLSVSYPSNNGETYNLKITRKLWAVSDRPDIVDSYASFTRGITYTNSAYYYIDTPTFVSQLKNVLKNPNNTFNIKEVTAVPNLTTTTFYFTIPFTRTVKVNKEGEVIPDTVNPDGTITKGYTKPDTIQDSQVTFQLYVELSIEDSSIIKSFTVPSEVIEPIEFNAQKNLVGQNQKQSTTAQDQAEQQKALETQIKEALNSQSSLELSLRAIQLHALNRAIESKGLDIGKLVYTLKMTDSKERTFLNQVFSNGIFSSFLNELVEGNIDVSNYGDGLNNLTRTERLKIQSKYGFATSLMGNSAEIQNLSVCDFTSLLQAFVVPYQISQEIIKGVETNHPVYIPFGLVLMLLNHSCTIYDSQKPDSVQTPLVYIDFNTEHNYFLSNTKQLSTNPWVTLIPFEGSFNDYKALFSDNILNGNNIKPPSGSTEQIPLFNPQKQDALSSQLPAIKFDKSGNNIYRGKMMNILLNVDYLIKVVRDYSFRDGTNSIYLKEFIEQILTDVNKYLGKINLFRLSYNDKGNTFQIVDDQFIPVKDQEDQLSPKDIKTTGNSIVRSNTTEIPLFGKYSIAKSLDIKSDISTKLANMIAISSNAQYQNKATLSQNGDPYGYINTSYQDRYIVNKLGAATGSSLNVDSIINSATQFNETVSDFYSKINPVETSISHATNYFIDKMSKIKNDEYPTRASAMIPVSVNFTTDGISGFLMGQAFTISEELLPYTYTNRIVPGTKGLEQDHINKVGFVVVGLNHSLENNQWNTSVRANMIFLKDATEFSGSVVQQTPQNREFDVNYSNPNNDIPVSQTNFIAINKDAREAAELYLGRQMSNVEWNQLVSATFAEASGNQTERAWVMAVILNRTRTKYLGASTITDTLSKRNQFQAVTGTSANGNRPSSNYVSGPSIDAAQAIYGAAVNILPTVPKNYLFFTSNLVSAYGPGTDITFLDKLKKAAGSKIIGNTVFSISV